MYGPSSMTSTVHSEEADEGKANNRLLNAGHTWNPVQIHRWSFYIRLSHGGLGQWDGCMEPLQLHGKSLPNVLYSQELLVERSSRREAGSAW